MQEVIIAKPNLSCSACVSDYIRFICITRTQKKVLELDTFHIQGEIELIATFSVNKVIDFDLFLKNLWF